MKSCFVNKPPPKKRRVWRPWLLLVEGTAIFAAVQVGAVTPLTQAPDEERKILIASLSTPQDTSSYETPLDCAVVDSLEFESLVRMQPSHPGCVHHLAETELDELLEAPIARRQGVTLADLFSKRQVSRWRIYRPGLEGRVAFSYYRCQIEQASSNFTMNIPPNHARQLGLEVPDQSHLLGEADVDVDADAADDLDDLEDPLEEDGEFGFDWPSNPEHMLNVLRMSRLLKDHSKLKDLVQMIFDVMLAEPDRTRNLERLRSGDLRIPRKKRYAKVPCKTFLGVGGLGAGAMAKWQERRWKPLLRRKYGERC